ncbi:MAG: carbon-nitrogen hydrolase family protein [Betaproteobacteria bacterium]|jgi:deaminated glutathione amidase|nr:carbon-nitrogen hydrolase family protein [Betaproteobacteria bacterium]NBP44414.1 carbon-nitrogen hydrolase family protein [Betaproteobacteria bacterium]
MKVAALQMVSGVAWEQNLADALRLIRDAARQGAELVVLPEHFALLGRRDTDKLALREVWGQGPLQNALAGVARECAIWLVGGTLPIAIEGTDQQAYNTLPVWNPQGQCVARYDKIHLFEFDNGNEQFNESVVLRHGQQPVAVTLHDRQGQTWQMGLSVCYDLRFPELFRHYAQLGADVLVVPSAFTHTTGQAHWEVLLRARAIENQCAVLAAAQGGVHANGRHTWGDSLVIDAWGQVLNRLPQGEGVVMAELVKADQERVRAQLPALRNRRL